MATSLTLAIGRMSSLSGPILQDLEGSLVVTIANYDVHAHNQSFQAPLQSHILLDVLVGGLSQI